MKFRAAILLAAMALSACAGQQSAPASRTIPIPKPAPTLAAAIAHSTRLGPAGGSTIVYLSFGLKVRNQQSLDALLASGKTISPGEYAARFGPEPTGVGRAVAALHAAGFRATWQAPSGLIAADGPAPAADSLLGVDIESYRLAGGQTFYASTGIPRLPPEIAAVASDVSGLDSYRASQRYAVRPGGLEPADVITYYNLKPLRDSGLDGSGETILLPEIDDLPNNDDLEKFAKEFGLPPFGPILKVMRDPTWGTPEKAQGETVLDLEILHEVAPAAKLIVYLSAPDFGHGDRAFDSLVNDHLGSIISESLGSCEADVPAGARNNYASIQDRATALGISHFVASGDAGAYTCGLDQKPAPSFPATLPTVTAVGGTTVFESEQGVYFKEYAWSSPIDQSGGGGGASEFYTAPSYQSNERLAAGNGFREVPDVAADADPASGFHIVFGGKDGQVGGTSAATPLWAATVALVNQDLKRKGLREVGFANLALYWMGENNARLSPSPFHDVTAGNNLGYDAAPGFDLATGWGSMDAAALDAAWIKYFKSGGG